MSNQSTNNNRIVKNTFFLYSRMIIITGIGLFTTRITLKVLGIEDYGIFNVVAGAVGFLGMLNGTMTSATQRFLTFELGKGDINGFRNVFSMLNTIYFFLSLLLLLVGIGFGNWVVYDFLVIPLERQEIALWIYYFSIVSFIINLFLIPLTSSIIAYEKMSFYAYISLLEAILKMAAVYLLVVSGFDKLLTYGLLLMISSGLIYFSYFSYCKKFLKGCNYTFFWSSNLFKELSNYTGWNLFGSVTSILNLHGQSLILNLFFGPVINGAKAIADKINILVYSFSNNFYMAVRPQIIKSYASGDTQNMFNLVYKSSRFSFFLLFVIAFPLILLMREILVLWLGSGSVTDNMVIFSQLVLIYSLVNVFEQPISVMIQATGNIRNYQVVVGFFSLLFLPLSYFAFSLGAPAYFSMIILICIYVVLQFIRLYIAKRQLDFSLRIYLKTICIPILLVSLPSVALSYISILNLSRDIFGLFLSGVICLIIGLFFIWILGLNKSEKDIIVHKVQAKFFKK